LGTQLSVIMNDEGERTVAEPIISPEVVLRADRVDLVRDRRLLLDQISFEVRTGQHWALLGPNGAGKSTLLRLLATYAHPTRGTVDVLGHRLGRVDVFTLRPMVAHVTAHHPLTSSRTVREVVLTGLTGTIEIPQRWRPAEPDLRRAGAMLGLMGLARLADARWPTLSQGERGRTLIARALMSGPRVLLLDEPSAGLDIAGREQLLASIDDLRARQPALATILVTHHLEELPASTTHALLLRDGRAVAAGPADEVLVTSLVSACFDYPVQVGRRGGRWTATGPVDRAEQAGAAAGPRRA
jgi:iron complex transport system ATP-binding protein